jgi:uncharacterized protein
MIDFHTHLWPKEFLTSDLIRYFKSRNIWDEDASIMDGQRLLGYMDDNGIELSVLISVVLKPGMSHEQISKINRYTSRQVHKSSRRLAGFFTVDPFGGEKSLDEADKCVMELGLTGLKIHPSFQEVYPNDRVLYPLYKKMQEYGLPVLFHTGSIGIIPYRDHFSHPGLIDGVACDFPDLLIILGHGGKIWHKESAMLMRKHKNIYADISTNIGRDKDFSEHPMSWLLYEIKAFSGCLDRLVFGSDYPFYMQEETKDSLQKAAKLLNRRFEGFISKKEIDGILFKNAERLLGTVRPR